MCMYMYVHVYNMHMYMYYGWTAGVRPENYIRSFVGKKCSTVAINVANLQCCIITLYIVWLYINFVILYMYMYLPKLKYSVHVHVVHALYNEHYV